MPIPTFTSLPPNPQYEDVIAKINTIVGELQNLLLNLDTLNVTTLNAEVVEAGTITGDKIAGNTITGTNISGETITGDKIAANAITTDKINAGAVTAAKITVSQLSAIAADLGTITAGTIIGLLIKTALSGQRVEMDINGLRSVDASGKVRVIITPDGAFGVQGIDFQDETETYMGTLFSNATNKLSLVAHSDLNLSSQTGEVKINNNHVESTYANYLTYDSGTKVLTLNAKDSTILSSVTIT